MRLNSANWRSSRTAIHRSALWSGVLEERIDMQGQPVAPRTGLGPVQWILIGLGVVLLICCVFAFTAGQGITNLFQGNAPPPSNLNPVRSSPVPQNPSGQNSPSAQTLGDVELGQ